MHKIFSAILVAMIWTVSSASIPVISGHSRVPLQGTTLADRPSLKGIVVADIQTSYSATRKSDGAVLAGKIQSRVVRNVNGKLDFYWRVIPQPIGTVSAFQVHIEQFNAKTPTLDIDYRKDSLGQDPAASGYWSNNGIVEVLFNTGCSGVVLCPAHPGGSKFFFARTNATTYVKTGLLYIIANPGLEFYMPTFGPGALVSEVASKKLFRRE